MKKGSVLVLGSIIAVLVAFFVFSRFFVDLLWFSSLGYRAVFTASWLTVLAVFVVAMGLSFAILLLNGLVAASAASGPANQPQSFRIIGRSAQGLPEVIYAPGKQPGEVVLAKVERQLSDVVTPVDQNVSHALIASLVTPRALALAITWGPKFPS